MPVAVLSHQGGTETCECGDEVAYVVWIGLCCETFKLVRALDHMHLVLEPRDDSSCVVEIPLEHIGEPALEVPGNACHEAMYASHRCISCHEYDRRVRVIRCLHLSRFEAVLCSERCLGVFEHRMESDGGGESAFEVRDFEEGIRRQDFGKRLARDAKELEEIFVPLSCLEIQELCPAGVRGDLYRVRRYRLRS